MRVLELVSIDHNSVQVKRNNSVQVKKKNVEVAAGAAAASRAR